MNDNTRDGDVQAPMQIMGEQSLAVDLAAVEIDRQIATAHKFPRILDVVLKNMATMACYNEAAAENCIYSLPRGGKPIIGPSIGFANIVAQAWGNCIDGGRPIYADRKEKSVIAEGVFHDLQSNRKTVVHVSRRIVDKNGRLYSDDMIAVTGMAAASIARRNAIINAVPRALWHPIYEDALAIVKGTVETFTASKDKALKSFAQFGIKPDQIIAFIGLKGEIDLTLEHIPMLRGAYAALRDGTLTPEEVLDPRRQAAGSFETVSNPLGDDARPPQTAAGASNERPPGPRQDGEGGDEDDADDGAPGGDQPPQGDQQQAQTTTAATTTAPAAGNAPQQPAQPDVAAPSDDAGKTTTKAKRRTAADKAKDAEPKQPAAAATPPATADKPAATEPAKSAAPKTAEQYRDHAKTWIAAATSASGLDDQWKSERDLRTTCMVVEDIFAEVRAAKEARMAELKAKGPA